MQMPDDTWTRFIAEGRRLAGRLVSDRGAVARYLGVNRDAFDIYHMMAHAGDQPGRFKVAIVSALCPVMALSHMPRRQIAAHVAAAQDGHLPPPGASRSDMLRDLDAQLAREGFPAAGMLVIDELAGDRIPQWLLADRPEPCADEAQGMAGEDEGDGERELRALLQDALAVDSLPAAG